MPRKKLIKNGLYCYHVTSRSNNKEYFYIPSSEVWHFSINLLKKGIVKFDVKVHAFVLMSNHYHLLIRTPHSNIDKFMHFFNKSLGQSISRAANRINRIFGAPYSWSLIEKRNYYFNVYRYIYQNPIRAKIVGNAESYPFSTIFKKKKNLIINENYIDFSIEDELNWLNQNISKQEDNLIKIGLKKSYFVPGRNLKHWKRKSLL